MLREALEYIVGLGESKQHEINGSIYSDKELYRVDTYFPKALAIELNTLTGLVDYIKSSIDEMPGKMIVDVKDPETVRLYSQLDPNRDRETLVIVRARVPEFYFNRFINQEEFCINMQSKFIDDTATDRALLLKFAGTVESGTLAEYGDDGVTQKATVKTGIASKGDVLHGEGIPLIVPIDQEKVVRAVQVNSKISKGLYSRLGEDVDLLKRKITAQISRGVATGMSYSQMAQQLAGYTKTGYNNAVRITRTEGHRIQQESTMDACYAARERGADVVKQWDATMDANTRESHQMVDGEVRALDEKFSNGLMYPGDPSGSAAEVINCRCVLLQRAKWALDQKELDRLKERASFYGLDKRKSFDEFNKKYIGTVENSKGNKIKMDLQFFAKIPDEKLTEYALNFEHPTGKEKAKAFKEALGYTKESYTDLKTKILDSFDEKELVYKREDKYGKRYEQIMQITGPNGKTANVLTAWIKDNDNAEPRLTSIYVDKR